MSRFIDRQTRNKHSFNKLKKGIYPKILIIQLGCAGKRITAQALLSLLAWFFQWSQNFCWDRKKMASIFTVVLKLKIIRILPWWVLWEHFPHLSCCASGGHSLRSVSITTASLPAAGDGVQDLLQNLGGVSSCGFSTLSAVPVVFLSVKENNWTNHALQCFTLPLHRNLSWVSLQQQLLHCWVWDVTQWEENPYGELSALGNNSQVFNFPSSAADGRAGIPTGSEE